MDAGNVAQWAGAALSVVALAQPWVIKLWCERFRPGSVEIHETGTIEVRFDGVFGASVALLGTLRALDRDLFVSAARLTVTRERDGSRHVLDWAAFRPQKVDLSNPAQGAWEVAGGFMLLQAQPHLYSILFVDDDLRAEIASVA